MPGHGPGIPVVAAYASKEVMDGRDSAAMTDVRSSLIV
jgi:hypothetical protein